MPPSLSFFAPHSKSLSAYLHLFFYIVNPPCVQHTHTQRTRTQTQTPNKQLDQHYDIFIHLHIPVLSFLHIYYISSLTTCPPFLRFKDSSIECSLHTYYNKCPLSSCTVRYSYFMITRSSDSLLSCAYASQLTSESCFFY